MKNWIVKQQNSPNEIFEVLKEYGASLTKQTNNKIKYSIQSYQQLGKLIFSFKLAYTSTRSNYNTNNANNMYNGGYNNNPYPTEIEVIRLSYDFHANRIEIIPIDPNRNADAVGELYTKAVLCSLLDIAISGDYVSSNISLALYLTGEIVKSDKDKEIEDQKKEIEELKKILNKKKRNAVLFD